MSYILGAGAGATMAAITAAKAAREKQNEEENMTSYHKEDLDGWEFKIVRANTEKFANFETIQKLCQEESKAGWEMVEKFDNNRIRFKRRVEMRSKDQYLDIDPYRTTYGISSGKLGFLIAGSVLITVGLILTLVLLMKP